MDVNEVGKWMSGMGAIIGILGLGFTIVVVAGVFFLLYKIFSGMGRANAERERLLREGIQARARILNVQMGGMTMTVGVHRHLQLKLTIEVQPPSGSPYQTVLTTMVSELQIPQVQPGVEAVVRYDRNDPSKVALEAFGAGAAAAVGSGGRGGARAAVGGGGVVVPVAAQPRMGAGAKIGLAVGLCGAVVGIGVAIFVTVMVAGGSLGLGALSGSSSSKGAATGDSVCDRAIRCCETIGGAAGNCGNLGKFGVPSSACQSALESYERAAKMMGKKCK
jgi:hypothetical protein